MIVLIRDAWPGQSTKVYWTFSMEIFCEISAGASTWKEEKPRSRVMPRSLLCGFLSKLAVLATVLRAFDKLVLPLSTWPRTPTLKFNKEAAILNDHVIRWSCSNGHTGMGSTSNKNEKWDPLRAMKTFIRRKVGHTTGNKTFRPQDVSPLVVSPLVVSPLFSTLVVSPPIP